jgi:hypothetical protein
MNLMHFPPDIGDPQWTSTLPHSIAMVENNIGIVVASLVVMRPCFRFIANIFHGRPKHEGLDDRRGRQKYKVSNHSGRHRLGGIELRNLSGKLGGGPDNNKNIKLQIENSMVSDEELLVRLREDYGPQYLGNHGSGR